MHDATKLALGIVLIWVAGMAFFVAFHPNGVQTPDGQPAKNPADVIQYVMSQARGGVENGSQQSSGQSS